MAVSQGLAPCWSRGSEPPKSLSEWQLLPGQYPLATVQAALGGAGALCQPAMSSQRQGAQSRSLQGPPEPAWLAALCCKKLSWTHVFPAVQTHR